MSVPTRFDASLPVSFEASVAGRGASDYLADPSIRLLLDFFRAKGLARLKEEDRREDWYQDWIDYQARHGIHAGLLCPERHSTSGGRFDVRRFTRFLEVAAYFSPAHAYSLHVSFLGLFPILMSDNTALAKEAVSTLAAGGLFAFAVSEKEHGSDLFANEFTVLPNGPGRWIADGSKYYIGNANAASIVSVLARDAEAAVGGGKRSPFVFFALRPAQAPAFQQARKIRTIGVRTAFVGEFEVHGHEFTEEDVIARGRAAWDALFNTIDLGKFFLGFGAIGICEHAFAEAYAHMRSRMLYGSPVTDLAHIRMTVAVAHARLLAMKSYAVRALDYLEAAGPGERRYLLFNAVQKARVSTEGVRVIGLLSECIGARGLETETYFESALRDVQLVPGLEGSTHINFGLTAQFVAPYFAAADGEGPEPPVHRTETGVENPHWFRNPNRNAKSVRFGPFRAAYAALSSGPNVRTFVRQVEGFHAFATGISGDRPLRADAGLRIAIGRCFSVVAFAQLVAESCTASRAVPAVVSLIFHSLVEDLSAEALKLSGLLPAGHVGRGLLDPVVRVPETSAAAIEEVWKHIDATYGDRKR